MKHSIGGRSDSAHRPVASYPAPAFDTPERQRIPAATSVGMIDLVHYGLIPANVGARSDRRKSPLMTHPSKERGAGPRWLCGPESGTRSRHHPESPQKPVGRDGRDAFPRGRAKDALRRQGSSDVPLAASGARLRLSLVFPGHVAESLGSGPSGSGQLDGTKCRAGAPAATHVRLTTQLSRYTRQI